MKQQETDKDKALILTHGDKFLTHCVFTALSEASFQDMEKFVRAVCHHCAKKIIETYPRKRKSYPAADFENVRALEDFKEAIDLFEIVGAANETLVSREKPET